MYMKKFNKSKLALLLATLYCLSYQSKAITGDDVRTVGKPVNNLMSRLAAYKLCFGDSNYKYFWIIPAVGVPIGIAYCADYIDRKNTRDIFAEYLKKSLYISDDYDLSSMISDMNYIKNKFNSYFEKKSNYFTDSRIDLDFNCDKNSITKYKITKSKISFGLKNIEFIIGENNFFGTDIGLIIGENDFFDKVINFRRKISQKLSIINKQDFIATNWNLCVDNDAPDMPFHVKICRNYDNKEKSKKRLSVVFSVSFDIKIFNMAPMPTVKYKVCFKLADKDKLELQINDQSYGYIY